MAVEFGPDDESELKLDEDVESHHAVRSFLGRRDLAMFAILPHTGSPTLMSYLDFDESAAVVGRLPIEMCVTGRIAVVADDGLSSFNVTCDKFISSILRKMLVDVRSLDK
jgi:hypothetical protein